MVALCAQLLLRMLMAKAEGLAQTPMARGQDWSPLEKHPLGRRALCLGERRGRTQ